MSAYAATGMMAAGEGYALDQLETNRQLRELTHSLLGLPPPHGRDRRRRLTTTMATDYAADQSQEEIVATTRSLASSWLSKQ
jgi:hypothetical protein